MSPFRPGSFRFARADHDLFFSNFFSLAGKKKTQRLLTTLGSCDCHDMDETTNKQTKLGGSRGICMPQMMG
jgi:predicted lactoylglutathione lyase